MTRTCIALRHRSSADTARTTFFTSCLRADLLRPSTKMHWHQLLALDVACAYSKAWGMHGNAMRATHTVVVSRNFLQIKQLVGNASAHARFDSTTILCSLFQGRHFVCAHVIFDVSVMATSLVDVLLGSTLHSSLSRSQYT